MNSTTINILSIYLDDKFSLVAKINPWLFGLFVIILAIIIITNNKFNKKIRKNDFEIDRAELGLQGGKIIFKPNNDDRQIAYQIWVELSTRKIGLPINLKDDVICEIYDSWHNFFTVTRELIKSIPVNKTNSTSTKDIINLSIELLNEELRPHLTKWQARFRHWYNLEIKNELNSVDPQEIQSRYHNFLDLEKDMMDVNKHLIIFREKMYLLAMPNNKK